MSAASAPYSVEPARASRRVLGVGAGWLGLILAGGALLVLRRPESFIAAEFTWEEGNAFYAPLFFHPPGALVLEPWGGYLQVVPRLGYELLRLVPVAWAPLAENLLASAAILTLAAYVASSRLADLIPSSTLRIALAALLLLLPAQADVMGSWVNVQWYGALWLALLGLVSPPASSAGRWGERIVAALVAVSGPFSTLLAPVFWLRFARSRGAHDAWLAGIVTTGGAIQLAFALTAGRIDVPDPRPIEMTLATFALHVGIVPVLGERLSNALGDAGLPAATLFVAGVALIATLVLAGVRTLPGRAIPMGYAAAVVGLSGVAIHGGANIWPPGENERYFLIGAALTVATVAVATAQRRLLAIPLAALVGLGFAADFRLESHPAQGWERHQDCIGSPSPCVIPVWPREYDIHWPGSGGVYELPEHVDP